MAVSKAWQPGERSSKRAGDKPKRKGKKFKKKRIPRRGRIDLSAAMAEVLDRHVPPEVQRLSRLRNLWIEILPASFADHVWPTLVQGPRLLVHVHDSQWLHEMTYWRQELLDRLGRAWPESGIQTIEAFVGPIPPVGERRPGTPPPLPVVDRSPVLDAEVPGQTIDALNEIRDERLREVLAQARFMLGKPRD